MFINLRNATVTLNGHVCEGWADEDDALMFPNTTLANVTRGADGKMQASSTGNLGDAVEFKFLATSRTVKFLSAQVAHIKNGGLVTFNGTVVDGVNNVSVVLSRGVLTEAMDHPSLGQGAASTVTYKIEFESIQPDHSSAKFVKPPAVTAEV